jgi:hypothetical protein
MVTVGNRDQRCTFNNSRLHVKKKKKKPIIDRKQAENMANYGQKTLAENEANYYEQLNWPDFFFSTESTTKEQTLLEYV